MGEDTQKDSFDLAFSAGMSLVRPWLAAVQRVSQKLFSCSPQHVPNRVSRLRSVGFRRRHPMFRFCSSVVLLFLSASLFGPSLEGAWDERGMGPAEVSADSQKAFAEASSSSPIVYILKKGDLVKVILRISASGENWCRILLPGQAGLTGYVPCKALASASSVTPVSGTGAVPVAQPVVVAVTTEPFKPAAANVHSLTNNDISEMSGAGLPA
jgi:hypothetical protein